MAAEQKNDMSVEDNAMICGKKSFDNSELQQFTTESNIVQVNEAVNFQGLMFKSLNC